MSRHMGVRFLVALLLIGLPVIAPIFVRCARCLGEGIPEPAADLNGVWKVESAAGKDSVFADLIGVKIAIHDMTMAWQRDGITGVERKTIRLGPGGGPRGIDSRAGRKAVHTTPLIHPTTVRCPGKRTRNV